MPRFNGEVTLGKTIYLILKCVTLNRLNHILKVPISHHWLQRKDNTLSDWDRFILPLVNTGISYTWERKRDPDDILPVMLWCIIPFCKQWDASRKCSMYLFLKDWFLDRKSHFAFSLTNKGEIWNWDRKVQHGVIVNSDTLLTHTHMYMHVHIHTYTHIYILMLAMTDSNFECWKGTELFTITPTLSDCLWRVRVHHLHFTTLVSIAVVFLVKELWAEEVKVWRYSQCPEIQWKWDSYISTTTRLIWKLYTITSHTWERAKQICLLHAIC